MVSYRVAAFLTSFTTRLWFAIDEDPIVLLSHIAMVSMPINSQLFSPSIHSLKLSDIVNSGGQIESEAFIFMPNLSLKSWINPYASLPCMSTQFGLVNSMVSVFRYSQMACLRCYARCPSKSASTAVLHMLRIGISPGLRCFYCLLNQVATSIARALEGTARTFIQGVFIFLPSSFIWQLHWITRTYGAGASLAKLGRSEPL